MFRQSLLQIIDSVDKLQFLLPAKSIFLLQSFSMQRKKFLLVVGLGIAAATGATYILNDQENK